MDPLTARRRYKGGSGDGTTVVYATCATSVEAVRSHEDAIAATTSSSTSTSTCRLHHGEYAGDARQADDATTGASKAVMTGMTGSALLGTLFCHNRADGAGPAAGDRLMTNQMSVPKCCR